MELTISERFETRSTSKNSQYAFEFSFYVWQRNMGAKKLRQKTVREISNEVLRPVQGISLRDRMSEEQEIESTIEAIRQYQRKRKERIEKMTAERL
jgi:hypothetical protein